jgi:hypothetical protein
MVTKLGMTRATYLETSDLGDENDAAVVEGDVDEVARR